MSAPLPLALRTRFQTLIGEGLGGRAAASRLKPSAATGARRARQVRRKGDADPAPQGRPPGRGKPAPHQAFFEELIAQDPDITLFGPRDALAEGVTAHRSSIANPLSRLGFTYRKSRWRPPDAAAPRQGGDGPTGSGIAFRPSRRRLSASSSLTERR